MDKKTIFMTIVCLILSTFVFFFEYNITIEPVELYRVYLAGDTIGYIKDKSVFEKYIDDEQIELKEKYKVDRVYPPNDLDIVKEVTYIDKVSTEKEIYEKIKGISPFTINGYTVSIKDIEKETDIEGSYEKEDVKINIINKDIFEKAMKDSVLAFIPEEVYNNFINGKQEELKGDGSIIENLYIKNNISIKEGRVSTSSKIFTTATELEQYLLFGTTEKQKKYKVKSGETISEIAETNKLNVSEFLVANPDFTSENNLLYEGQEVNIGLIKPLFNLIEENHTVTTEVKRFDTTIKYDENMLAGYQNVEQEGSDGLSRITRKVQKQNGDIKEAVIVKEEILKPVQNRIIVKGKKVISYIAIPGEWTWPTSKPYTISSEYGWRGYKFHEGIDIITNDRSTSPIYAANNATVESSGYNSYNGHFIVLDHGNGLLTYYGHLSSRLVSVGQVVESGQLIGYMGQSGYATGVHLHFGVYRDRFITRNNAGAHGPYDISPWSLFS